MILEPGAGRVLAPFSASTVTVENRSTAATRVRVGDAADTILAPLASETVSVTLDAETSVTCLGPGAVELSWRVDPDAATQHPDYKDMQTRAVLADPWRDAITTAWRKAFEAGVPDGLSLPAQLKKFDPVTLPDVRNIELTRGFTTICPGWDQGSSWADGKGKCDLTSLILRNLATAKRSGDPVFSDSDRKVAFQFRVDNLRLDGRCTIRQRCCTGFLGWCITTGDYSGWNPFELSMEGTDVRFEAVAVDDPVTGVRVNVTDTSLVITGPRTIRFPGPDWLPDWLKWLTEAWAGMYEFKNATQMASEQALKQPGVRNVLQQVVNAWLGQKAAEDADDAEDMAGVLR